MASSRKTDPGKMNFSRFPRTNMFDMMRREPAAPASSRDTDPTSSGLPNGAGLPTSSSATPTILTRPRAGASITGGSGMSAPGAGSGAGAGQNQGLGGSMEEGATDSITLGQLKAHGPQPPPKQKASTKIWHNGKHRDPQLTGFKVSQFDYRYDDTDTLMTELDEFYPYVEMPQIGQNPSRFEGSFRGEWTEAPLANRRAYMEVQLEYLESPFADVRRAAQGRLLYLLQGCFAETTSPEMQLHWIIENAKTLRSVDGVPSLVIGLRDAARRYDAAVGVSEQPIPSSSAPGTSTSPVEPYNEVSSELMETLAMLYFVVEVFRGDETFGDELMTMNPPLPLILFRIVCRLKDNTPKGYPMKKLLLLLWKTLLACLGGMKEAAKARDVSRELAGLPPEDKNFTKASPFDIATFRRDTSVKYPTFDPPTSSSTSTISNDKLADSLKPIPARLNYHSTEIANPPRLPGPPSGSAHPMTAPPFPGTPAPSPPASPAPQTNQKQKKQQFQTDPSRPFVFPYSRSTNGGPSSLVPFAIAEADKLYQRHAYVSLGLTQMWEAREELIGEERGLGRSGLIGFASDLDEEDDVTEEEAMRRDWRYEEEEQECLAQGNKEGAKAASAKRAAAKRLHRVDIIYRATLPIMQNCVIVLLKLLLATVTGPGATAGLGGANGTLGPGAGAAQHQALAGVGSPTNEQPPAPAVPLTREEVDVARHREITSKAVSAILILIMKWFKASHVLKFHFFAQLLFDSNCLLLSLKMFGLNDVYQMVQARHEWEKCAFFRHCYLMYSRAAREGQASDGIVASPRSPTKTINDAGEEIEIIHEYSWRNFFTSINFLKILQKMTKHRAHRTFMLNQYKSSQILKRMLRVNQPMLQLQVLKLIKSQMPWCGRKWRQTNMKVITSIYLNCRPELRDEWLSGTDQDNELDGAMPQEHALRSLIQFYNKRYYSAHLPPIPSPSDPSHKRSDSIAAVTLEDPALRPPPHIPHRSSMTDLDVFPPSKTDAALPYNPDGMIEFWLHEYEDVLGEVFGDGERDEDWVDMSGVGAHAEVGGQEAGDGLTGRGRPLFRGAPDAAERDDRAWNALGEIMGDEDAISDSESVVSVGELGEDARMGAEELGDAQFETGPRQGQYTLQQRRRSTDNENTWEHMSLTTLSLLPKSPAERRRSSSSGSPLRPVGMHSVMLDRDVFGEEEEDLPGPMPIERETRDEEEREFGAVDEVEYAYGE